MAVVAATALRVVRGSGKAGVGALLALGAADMVAMALRDRKRAGKVGLVLELL